MRKVTTINLNNNACQIDEDGYDALHSYLDDAEQALANNPDRGEILADLEQAIADKCRLALGPYKTVVSAAEIERILKEMGPVVGSAEDAATPGSGATSSAAPAFRARPRRLFRVLDGKQWTGVCNGLAAFAGVDVTWVRVAFVLLTLFTGGFWLVAYVVMIFLMPIASTPEEIAAAHGQPFSAQELVDRVRTRHAEFRAGRRARRSDRHGHWFAAQPASQGPPPAAASAARVAGGVMLPVFTLLSAGWFALMIVAAFIVWHAGQNTGFPYGAWTFPDLPRWIALLAIIAVYAVLALPIGAGRRAALFYANGGRRQGWASGWSSGWSSVLWFALVTVLLLAAWALLPQLRGLLPNLFGWPVPRLTAGWI